MNPPQNVVGERIRSPQELWWARNRPPQHRPPLPQVGDTVLYRSNDFFLDLKEAKVVAVDNDNPADLNLWEWMDGRIIRVFDPWPLLTLKVDGYAILVQTREARLEGSAGWLPLDWQRWPRPIHNTMADVESAPDPRRWVQ